jgi:FAD/FMN-containing dehydrogenase
MYAKSLSITAFLSPLPTAIWELDRGCRVPFLLRLLANLSDSSISRLLLGGGYGFLTGQYGLVVDNLLQVWPLSTTPHDYLLRGREQATIVTADGTTLTLSEIENAELFWGIRGGGCNFGVCTEFTLRLHPQRRTVFSGLVVFSTDVLSELMAVLTKWWKNAKKNEGMHMILRKDLSLDKVGINFYLRGVHLTRL